MATIQEIMDAAMAIHGALGVAIVDWKTGLTLGTKGNGLNLELAASSNNNVLRANQKMMQQLGLQDNVEDLLITLSSQYHLIRPLEANPNLYIYMVLRREAANLGMARYELQMIEKQLMV